MIFSLILVMCLLLRDKFDAMPFMEIGLNAVGLGGTNEIMRLKKQLKEHSSNKILILALDNDKAGKRRIPCVRHGSYDINATRCG